VALPAWLAVMTHWPAANRFKAVPLVVHTLGEPEEKLTGKPELALATKAGAAEPKRWLPGDVKVMLWAMKAAATAKLLTTGVAAA
jgi:hypothetical protein